MRKHLGFAGAFAVALTVAIACAPQKPDASTASAGSARPSQPLSVIELQVKDDGSIQFNDELITMQELEKRLAALEARGDAPEIHIIPGAKARYRDVSAIFAMVQRHGLQRMGVIGGT